MKDLMFWPAEPPPGPLLTRDPMVLSLTAAQTGALTLTAGDV